MPDSKVILPYRVRKKTTVGALLLVALGTVGFVFAGEYLYRGGRLELNDGVALQGNTWAACFWGFAVLAAAVTVGVFLSWRMIVRRRPRVVLETDAVTVPSKWRMTPTRIPIADITKIVWSKKAFGKVGYLWLWNKNVKMVIVEDMLEKGDAQRIVDWITTRQQAMLQPTDPSKQ